MINWTDVIVVLIGSCSSLLVAIVETNNIKYRKKIERQEQEQKEQEKQEKEEKFELYLASSELLVSVGKLANVTAKKVNGHQTNGDVEEALDSYQDSSEMYNKIIKKIITKHMA
jgi:hypothetical protein